MLWDQRSIKRGLLEILNVVSKVKCGEFGRKHALASQELIQCTQRALDWTGGTCYEFWDSKYMSNMHSYTWSTPLIVLQAATTIFTKTPCDKNLVTILESYDGPISRLDQYFSFVRIMTWIWHSFQPSYEGLAWFSWDFRNHQWYFTIVLPIIKVFEAITIQFYFSLTLFFFSKLPNK